MKLIYNNFATIEWIPEDGEYLVRLIAYTEGISCGRTMREAKINAYEILLICVADACKK